jgi:hypothetical protein
VDLIWVAATSASFVAIAAATTATAAAPAAGATAPSLPLAPGDHLFFWPAARRVVPCSRGTGRRTVGNVLLPTGSTCHPQRQAPETCAATLMREAGPPGLSMLRIRERGPGIGARCRRVEEARGLRPAPRTERQHQTQACPHPPFIATTPSEPSPAKNNTLNSFCKKNSGLKG